MKTLTRRGTSSTVCGHTESGLFFDLGYSFGRGCWYLDMESERLGKRIKYIEFNAHNLRHALRLAIPHIGNYPLSILRAI